MGITSFFHVKHCNYFYKYFIYNILDLLLCNRVIKKYPYLKLLFLGMI